MVKKITLGLLELETYLLSELKKASLNYDNDILFKDDEIAKVLGVEKFSFEMLMDAAKSVEKKIGEKVAKLQIRGSSVYFHIERPVGQDPEVEDLKNYFKEKVQEVINSGKQHSVINLEELAYSQGVEKGMKGRNKITFAMNVLVSEMNDKIEIVPGNTRAIRLKH